MERLNFPDFNFRIKGSDPDFHIFDIIRKKFVALSPEEWVRQNVLHLFTETLKYPPTLISVEKQITQAGKTMRYDIVVYNRNHVPAMIVECKQAKVKLSSATVEQVTRYNAFAKAGYVYITNGITHFIYNVDFINSTFKTEDKFPAFNEL